jgi:hypothetical protein
VKNTPRVRLPEAPKVDVLALVEENDYLRTRVSKLEKQVASYPKGLPGFLRCSVCRVPKPTTEFWRDSSNKWGYRSQCKDCALRKKGLTLSANCA